MATEKDIARCWNEGILAFGTAHIFEERYKKSRRNLRFLTFFGLVIPVVVGGIVVSFFAIDSLKPVLAGLIVTAGILSTLQLAFTIWSLVKKWDDVASYAIESSIENKKLSKLYSQLASKGPSDLEVQLKVLLLSAESRNQSDERQEVTAKEKREGMRAGLVKFQRKCVICNNVPKDMKPSKCNTCGNF